jgi:hypothetical protein
VERMVSGRGIICRRRRTAGNSGHHRDPWGLAEGQGAQGVAAVEGTGGKLLRVRGSRQVGQAARVGTLLLAGGGEEGLLRLQHVQGRHLRGRGQPVRIRVHTAGGAAPSSWALLVAAPEAWQVGPRGVLTPVLLLPQRPPAAAALLGQGVLVSGEGAQEKGRVHALAEAFGLLLPAWPVLVIGVVLHVLKAQPLRLVHVGPLLRQCQRLPRLSCSHKPKRATVSTRNAGATD